MFGRRKHLIGLDIGSSAVKAIELVAARRGLRVSALAVEPLPPHTIDDRGIADGQAVGAALERLLGTKAFRGTDVALSLSGHSVIVKKISLPVMSADELASSIRWEAEQHIPFPIDEVNLDYEVVAEHETAGGHQSMDVLLVAAKKDVIAGYTRLVSAAGRRPVVVDVDAFALQNAYEANYDVDGTIVGLLNIGAGATNVNIIGGTRPVFTRDISRGGQAYTEALQRELGVEDEAAEQLKRGTDAGGVSAEDARPVLRAVTDNLVGEIAKTLDFFAATSAAGGVARLMVSGGASRIDGLLAALRERFQVPVDRLDPFRRVTLDPRVAGGVDPAELAPVSAVAMGLALRQAGDR